MLTKPIIPISHYLADIDLVKFTMTEYRHEHLSILTLVIDSIIDQLNIEEELMYRVKYPKYIEHIKDHSAIIDLLSRILFTIETEQEISVISHAFRALMSHCHYDLHDLPLIKHLSPLTN